MQGQLTATFVPFDRSQAFLPPPDMKAWLPDDDLAHFIAAAAERVGLSAFKWDWDCPVLDTACEFCLTLAPP